MPWICVQQSVRFVWTHFILWGLHLVVLVRFPKIFHVLITLIKRKRVLGPNAGAIFHCFFREKFFQLHRCSWLLNCPYVCVFASECGLVCHVKCSPNLPHTCGLPSQFVEHFSETLHEQKSDINKNSKTQSTTKLGGRREGWLRVPRYGIFSKITLKGVAFFGESQRQKKKKQTFRPVESWALWVLALNLSSLWKHEIRRCSPVFLERHM